MISPAPASEIFDFTFNYFPTTLGTSVNLILIYLVLSRGVQLINGSPYFIFAGSWEGEFFVG